VLRRKRNEKGEKEMRKRVRERRRRTWPENENCKK
jgi:hypothetical protein